MGTIRVWEYFYNRGVATPLEIFYKDGNTNGIKKQLAELGYSLEDTDNFEKSLLEVMGYNVDITKLSSVSAYLNYFQAHDNKYGTQFYNELSSVLYATIKDFCKAKGIQSFEDGVDGAEQKIVHEVVCEDGIETMQEEDRIIQEEVETTQSNIIVMKDEVKSDFGNAKTKVVAGVNQHKEVSNKKSAEDYTVDMQIEDGVLIDGKSTDKPVDFDVIMSKVKPEINNVAIADFQANGVVAFKPCELLKTEDGVEYRALNDSEYCGCYYASSDGKIFNSSHYELYGQRRKGGFFITLSHDCKVKREYRSKLIAATFIPNEHGYTEVNHKNGDIEDDSVDNLEWVADKPVASDYSQYDFTVLETELQEGGNRGKPIILQNLYTRTDIEFPSLNAAKRYVARVFGLKESSTLILLSRAMNDRKPYRCFKVVHKE